MNLRKLLLASIVALTAAACSKDDIENSKFVDVLKVEVVLPADAQDTDKGDVKITMKGARASYEALTNEEGIATFENVVQDSYDISAVKGVTATLSYSAQLTRHGVFSSTPINIQLLQVQKQSLIISKLYVSGVIQDNGTSPYSNDVYVEFYNNSDSPVTLDKTYYFGFVDPLSNNGLLPIKSSDSTFLRQVFRFIKDETTKTIEPGKSIVITNSAVNHKLNGVSKSVDLTISDFEAKNTKNNPINNTAVPALDVMHSYLSTLINLNLTYNGLNGLILFKTDLNVMESYPLKSDPSGSNKGQNFLHIPNTIVLDALEVLPYKSSGVDLSTKRMNKVLDLGYVVNAERSTGKVIARKKSTVNGKIVLQDTNNSSNDFELIDDNTPKKY